ncbi:hypothetical protein QR680_010119 [Steinernema hermaphroditum]|uniref:Major facilitator superfamily (MFS) profile domain-containing protein n=1 Tax=Steinernema hermaphroditum TaxID=289476 RepID=A0AA39IMU3_9BILA|nr:hypothetical protein QR680_010119 [Steinernema hermaphroditum]
MSYILLIAFGSVTIDIGLNTIYGRILGQRRQGTMQGILMLSTGLARTVGPLSLTTVYSMYGPKFIWIIEMALICVVLCIWGVVYRRLVAPKVPNRKDMTY